MLKLPDYRTFAQVNRNSKVAKIELSMPYVRLKTRAKFLLLTK
ncbi:hypothetical protein [Siphonobacter curvatus]|nr:hypothetical protein [Siphonobacter curvatus]